MTNPDLQYSQLWYVSKYVMNDTRGVITCEKESRKKSQTRTYT